jgi:hypothetical protein
MKYFFVIKILILVCLTTKINSWTNWTLEDDDGGGDVIFLDRHNVYCGPAEAMTGFGISRPRGGRIQVGYSCSRNDGILRDTKDFVTDWKEAADDWFSQKVSANRLDKHDVKCPSDYGLRGFRVQTRCGGIICDIRIAYQCVELKVRSCNDSQTGWINGEDGQNYMLSKQWISLDNTRILTGFRLHSDSYFRWFNIRGMNFMYSYSYCDIRDVDAEKQKYINNKHSGGRILDDEELSFLGQS